jgi:hypothetical protein
MQQFDADTGRVVRAYVRYKTAPACAAVFILLGVLAFSILFPLAEWLNRTLYWYFQGGSR